MPYTVAGTKDTQIVARVAGTAKEALNVARDLATLGVSDLKIQDDAGQTFSVEEMERAVGATHRRL